MVSTKSGVYRANIFTIIQPKAKKSVQYPKQVLTILATFKTDFEIETPIFETFFVKSKPSQNKLCWAKVLWLGMGI